MEKLDDKQVLVRVTAGHHSRCLRLLSSMELVKTATNCKHPQLPRAPGVLLVPN